MGEQTRTLTDERKRRYLERFETFSEEQQARQLEIMVRWLIKVIEAQEDALSEPQTPVTIG